MRGASRVFAPAKAIDGRRETFWTTDDDVTTPELIVDLGKPITFNIVRLREHLPLGQRIDACALDHWDNDRWVEFAAATSIGSCRLLRTQPITTTKVRLRILEASAAPALAEFGLFADVTTK